MAHKPPERVLRIQKMLKDRKPEIEKVNKIFKKYSPLTVSLEAGSLREWQMKQAALGAIELQMQRLENAFGRRHPKAITVTSKDMLKATPRLEPIMSAESSSDLQLRVEMGQGERDEMDTVTGEDEKQQMEDEEGMQTEETEKKDDEEKKTKDVALQTKSGKSLQLKKSEKDLAKDDKKDKGRTQYYHTTRLAAWRATRFKDKSLFSETDKQHGGEKLQGLNYTDFLQRVAVMGARGDRGELETTPHPIQRIGDVPLLAPFKNKRLKVPQRSPLFQPKHEPPPRKTEDENKDDKKKAKKKEKEKEKEKQAKVKVKAPAPKSAAEKGSQKYQAEVRSYMSDDSLLTTVCSGCAMAARMRMPVLSRVDSTILRVTRKRGVWKRCRDSACQTDPIMTPTYVPTPSASDTGQGWAFLSDISVSGSSSPHASSTDVSLEKQRPYKEDAMFPPHTEQRKVPGSVTFEEPPRTREEAPSSAETPETIERDDFICRSCKARSETSSLPHDIASTTYTTNDSYYDQPQSWVSSEKPDTSEYSYSTKSSTGGRQTSYMDGYQPQPTPEPPAYESVPDTPYKLQPHPPPSEPSTVKSVPWTEQQESVMSVPLQKEMEKDDEMDDHGYSYSMLVPPERSLIHSMEEDSTEFERGINAPQIRASDTWTELEFKRPLSTQSKNVFFPGQYKKSKQQKQSKDRESYTEDELKGEMTRELEELFFSLCSDDNAEFEGVLLCPMLTVARSRLSVVGPPREERKERFSIFKSEQPMTQGELFSFLLADDNPEMEGVMFIPLQTAARSIGERECSVEQPKEKEVSKEPAKESEQPLDVKDVSSKTPQVQDTGIQSQKDSQEHSRDEHLVDENMPTEGTEMPAEEGKKMPLEEFTKMSVEGTENFTEIPTEVGTDMRTAEITNMPTEEGTDIPTEKVKYVPTEEGTEMLTEESTDIRTEKVTDVPTEEGSQMPTEEGPTDEAVPTEESSDMPIEEGSDMPTKGSEMTTEEGTNIPTDEIKYMPTEEGTEMPTEEGTNIPTDEVKYMPTEEGSETPTEEGTNIPTDEVKDVPTEEGIKMPTEEGTEMPSEEGTEMPTEEGTEMPTEEGTEMCAETEEAVDLEPPKLEDIGIQTDDEKEPEEEYEQDFNELAQEDAPTEYTPQAQEETAQEEALAEAGQAPTQEEFLEISDHKEPEKEGSHAIVAKAEAPVAAEETPVTENASVFEEEAPIAEKEATAAEEEVTEMETSLPGEEGPIAEEAATVVEEEAPKETSAVKEEAPVVEDEAPVAGEEAIVAEEEASVAEDVPLAEEKALVADEEALVVGHSPVEEPQLEEAPEEEPAQAVPVEEAPEQEAPVDEKTPEEQREHV